MIEVKNLNKQFLDKVIFEDASFSLPLNGLFVLDSDNGTGKTTLLKILAGIDQDYEGKIFLDRKEVTKIDCEYLDQRNNYISFLSVKDNYNLKSFFYKNIEILDINENKKQFLERKNANTLSEGEKLLVLLEKCERSKADVILLDEVTAALDSDNVLEIFKKIKEISKDKLVLFATHDGRLDTSNLSRIKINNRKIIIEYRDDRNPLNETKPSGFIQKSRRFPFKMFLKYLKSNLILSLIMLVATTFLGLVISMNFYDKSTSRSHILSYFYNDLKASATRSEQPYRYENLTFNYNSSEGLSLDDLDYIKSHFIYDNAFNNVGRFYFKDTGEEYFTISSLFYDELCYSDSDPNFSILNDKLIFKDRGFAFEMNYKITEDNTNRGYVDYDYFLSSFTGRNFGTNSSVFKFEFDQLNNKIDYLIDGNTQFFYGINNYLNDYKINSSYELKDNEILVNKRFKEHDGQTLEVIDNSIFDLAGDQNKYINMKDVFPEGAKVIYYNEISDKLPENLFLINSVTASKMLKTLNFIDTINIEAKSKSQLINFLLTGNIDKSENLFLTNFNPMYSLEGYRNQASREYGLRSDNIFMDLVMMPIFYFFVLTIYVFIFYIYFDFDTKKHRHDFDLLKANGLKDYNFVLFKYLKLFVFYLISILPGIIIMLIDPKLLGYGSNNISFSIANFNYLTFLYYLILFLILLLIFTLMNKIDFKRLSILKRKNVSKRE